MTTPRPATPRPATASRRRSQWTLRRRLVVVLVSLVAAVALAMGTVTTLALRGSLVSQIDQQLTAANMRAERADPNRAAPQGLTTTDGGTVTREALPPGLPPGARMLGQPTGTVSVFAPPDGSSTLASYLDDDGQTQPLSSAATSTMLDLPHDGLPRDVDLDGLGDYRAVAVETAEGAVVATALPTDAVTSTVTQYVVVEALVAMFALLAAAAIGLLLVRRELRPLDRVAATATRVSELPLDRGEVVLADRVAARDTDPATEVGQVGAALNRLLRHVESALAARHESESQVRQFVADASHELRTPLASIRGYAELVRRLPDEVPAGALQAMGRVESESERMTGLVEDMLLLARLDAGRPLATDDVDVAVLAVDAVTDAHAAGPDHVWRLDVPVTDDDAELLVTGDEDRLRQVLTNLVSNARVHTPAGTTVTVRVRRSAGSVVVQVADDGPGIPPELRSRVFDRFARGEASRTRNGGSTGLGLAIAHAVVSAHGGTLDVDCATGDATGTTFTVRLPHASAGRPAPAAGTAPAAAPVPLVEPEPVRA
ncbi:two-component sensor histidine kinase [Cellulomonas chitinilytica]|uniref:histidine kinase n=1 Tax=Cellulomonas chitinilytica TaxID=398759 RepID=A0A919U116_9CELL|nr:ATP-binding protein [Cellulomonas chitinilytica]GIG23525.1 two-component sensor histidine kinase [Cellulomonas chitinilytica]